MVPPVMITIERIYDDYLYDCYIANQRLTPDDWVYYGKEKHHVEIPNRDGGVLTPCNSQYLTRYQHWIAGVLQSEVLNKACHACVPSGVLPSSLDKIRHKWVTQQIKERWRQLTEEERSAEGKRAWINKSAEERSEVAKRSADTVRATYTPEKLLDRARRIARGGAPRPIILTTPEGEEIRYELQYDACMKHNLDTSKIGAICRGKRKTHKGFTARYAEL